MLVIILCDTRGLLIRAHTHTHKRTQIQADDTHIINHNVSETKSRKFHNVTDVRNTVHCYNQLENFFVCKLVCVCVVRFIAHENL